jgi:intracellular sulfur oxidation DsrE/DsrF family protein
MNAWALSTAVTFATLNHRNHNQGNFMRRNMWSVTAAIAGLLLLSLDVMPSAAYAEAADGMANNTKPPLQIVNQTGLKVVVQVNYADTVPNGVGKQVLAAKNLYDQYTALGMKAGKDYEIVMVFRGDGAQFLLTDEAYDQKVKQPHPKGNPNRAILDTLSKGGVTMEECGVAMKLKGYSPQDILPYSRIVASGIGALVELEKSGYLPVTP